MYPELFTLPNACRKIKVDNQSANFELPKKKKKKYKNYQSLVEQPRPNLIRYSVFLVLITVIDNKYVVIVRNHKVRNLKKELLRSTGTSR